MPKYSIADILIETTYDDSTIFDMFSFNFQDIANLKIDLLKLDYIDKPKGKMLLDERFKWVQISSDNIDNTNAIYSIYINSEDENEILYMLEASKNWSNARFSYSGKSNMGYAVNGPLSEILFRNTILYHQGIVVHAAAINWEGKGIIFSAPSGTGKSTQANLWKKHLGAEIINGDRPALRTLNGHSYVYGTPWSGATPEFLNSSVPLSAIILLEQAKKNTITQLTNNEIMSLLLPRCFLPYYDNKMMDLAIKNIESIITSTPVYLLSCKPDVEAVNLVYNLVK